MYIHTHTYIHTWTRTESSWTYRGCNKQNRVDGRFRQKRLPQQRRFDFKFESDRCFVQSSVIYISPAYCSRLQQTTEICNIPTTIPLHADQPSTSTSTSTTNRQLTTCRLCTRRSTYSKYKKLKKQLKDAKMLKKKILGEATGGGKDKKKVRSETDDVVLFHCARRSPGKMY